MAERNSVVVPIWYGSSRKPLSGVIGVLSAETESQPKECLREEGESKWDALEHEGIRREGIVTMAVEEGRGENIWNKVREVGMGQNIQGLWSCSWYACLFSFIMSLYSFFKLKYIYWIYIIYWSILVVYMYIYVLIEYLHVYIFSDCFPLQVVTKYWI